MIRRIALPASAGVCVGYLVPRLVEDGAGGWTWAAFAVVSVWAMIGTIQASS